MDWKGVDRYAWQSMQGSYATSRSTAFIWRTAFSSNRASAFDLQQRREYVCGSVCYGREMHRKVAMM